MADQGLMAIEPPAGEVAAGGMSRTKIIVAVAAVTVLAAGAGAGVGFLMKQPASVEAPAESETAEAPPQNPAAYAAESGPLTMVALTPIVTNISSPPSTVLRVEASLVVRADAGVDEALLATQVAADTLAFARTLDLAQIEGARGLLHLREDLRERAMLRSPAVADYVIFSLIAQ